LVLRYCLWYCNHCHVEHSYHVVQT
jgi:hypothetical protein